MLNTIKIAGQKHILNDELTQTFSNLIKTTATETSKSFAVYLRDREERYDEEDDLYPVDYERNEVCKLGEVLKSICKELISQLLQNNLSDLAANLQSNLVQFCYQLEYQPLQFYIIRAIIHNLPHDQQT